MAGVTVAITLKDGSKKRVRFDSMPTDSDIDQAAGALNARLGVRMPASSPGRSFASYKADAASKDPSTQLGIGFGIGGIKRGKSEFESLQEQAQTPLGPAYDKKYRKPAAKPAPLRTIPIAKAASPGPYRDTSGLQGRAPVGGKGETQTQSIINSAGDFARVMGEGAANAGQAIQEQTIGGNPAIGRGAGELASQMALFPVDVAADGAVALSTDATSEQRVRAIANVYLKMGAPGASKALGPVWNWFAKTKAGQSILNAAERGGAAAGAKIGGAAERLNAPRIGNAKPAEVPLKVVEGGKALPAKTSVSTPAPKPAVPEVPAAAPQAEPSVSTSHLTKAERAQFWATPYDALETAKGHAQAIIDAFPEGTAERNRAVDAMKILDERAAQRASQHPIPPTTDLEAALKQSIEARGGTTPPGEPNPVATPEPSPSAGASQLGPKQNYRAGQNNGTAQFANADQLSLFNAYRKANPKPGSTRAEGMGRSAGEPDLTGIQAFAESRGISEADAMAHAKAVYEDVTAQMKGVKDGETRALVDNVPPKAAVAPLKAAQTPKLNAYGASNKIVTKAHLDQALRDLMEGGTFAGLDPKKLKALGKIGAYHLEAGVREFGSWAIKVVDHVRGSLGDVAAEKVKPHLRAIWKEAHAQIGEKARPTRGPFKFGLDALDGAFATLREGVATGDISFPGIQGAILALTDTKAWARGVGAAFRSYGSKGFKEAMEFLSKDPDFAKVKASGVDLPGFSGVSEELFTGSALQRAPLGVGRGIKAAARSYDGSATVTRYMAAKSQIALAEAINRPLFSKAKPKPLSAQALKIIGDGVNSLSGRGTSALARKVQGADFGRGFFAPSYWISQFEAAFGKPFMQAVDHGVKSGEWGPAKLYARKYARMAVATGGALASAKALLESQTDWKVELDPRSSLFGKAYRDVDGERVAIDILPPQLSGPYRAVAMTALGKKKDGGSIANSAYDRMQGWGQLLEGKLAPGPKLGLNVLDSVNANNKAKEKGKPATGYPFGKDYDPREGEGLKNLALGATPISFQSAKEVYESKSLSVEDKLFLLPLLLFSRGPNVYETKKAK